MPSLIVPLLFADAVLPEDPASRFIRLLTVFLLAMWVGFEVITKVPQRLHTLLGFLAVVLAMINVAGGFVVTHRMLEMFQPKKK